MEVKDYTLSNKSGDKDFDVTVYGTSGRPVIVFPEGDSSCTSWENGGMVEALSDLIDGGEVQLFATDSVDDESWYFRDADPEYRYGSLKGFYEYVEGVLVPFVREHAGSDAAPILAGVGVGALNATVELFRRPQLFGGLLAQSGAYDVRFFIDGELDEAWDDFSPVALAANFDEAEEDLLSQLPIAFVVGQESSETGIETQRVLDTIFARKGIEATFEYWGYDVSHTWHWWQEEARQLLPCVVRPNGLTERKLVAKISAAKADAEHAAEVLQGAQGELEAAKEQLEGARASVKSTSERLAREDKAVEERQAEEERLFAVAKEAWSRRDDAQRVLDEAIAAGNAAQADADRAAEERSKAEWIRGEARAASDKAQSDKAVAKRRVAKAESALKAATEADKHAADALAAANEEMKAI